MPDQYGFNHLGPHHICIEEGCGWPGHGKIVTEKDRRKHAAMHERERQREIEAKRLAALAKGRKTKKQIDRENEAAYGGS